MAGVLVFTPIWRGVHPECVAAIEPQLGGGVEWAVDDRNPFPTPDYRNIRVKMQGARRRVLDEGFDALLTLDADCIVPPDAVAQIMATQGDVVYTPTLIRHGAHILSLWQYCGDRNIGMSLSNYPDELRKARAAGVWRVSGIGWSFTLIRRNVLEALDFRDDNGSQACDVPFAEDCLRAGFVSMANLNIPITHIDEDRHERLHPWGETQGAMQYVARETVNVLVGGRVLHLTAGQPVDLPPSEVGELIRAGYIETPTPETATVAPSEHAVMPKGSRKRG